MAYEQVTIEVENDDVEEWEAQLMRRGMARYVEDIWQLDDYKTVIEFDTNDKDILLEELKMISDQNVLYYTIDE